VWVAESEQTSALGAGIYAALAAGLFSTYNEATQVLGSQYIAEYHPNPIKVEKMKVLMKKYTELGISIENLTQ
jgi:L-ribulokinase